VIREAIPLKTWLISLYFPPLFLSSSCLSLSGEAALTAMNVRPPIESSSPTAVLSVAFNKDSSCFSVGLESGICGKMPNSCSLDETWALQLANHENAITIYSLSYKIMSAQGIKRYVIFITHTICLYSRQLTSDQTSTPASALYG
jgi:hypothetical protein